MFQKNLNALKFKNPGLAAKLEKINIEDIKDIIVIEAESKDLIINYKNTNIHSTLDPVREAKTTWYKTVKSELKRNDIQIVFGLGLGYLFKRAYVSANSKIFLIEPFINLLRFVLEYVDLSQEISDGRVFITDNLNELIQKIQAEFLAGDKIEFLFLNSYVTLAQSMLLDLTNKAVEICEGKSMDQNTIFNLCKFWTKNTIMNLPYFLEARSVGLMEGIFAKKAALIAAAGPSLASNIKLIKENRDKFVIIAVAPTLKTLINAGIIPDFAAFADPMYLNKHIEGIEDKIKDVNLIINSRAENGIIDSKFASKIIYLSETDSMAQWYKDLTSAEVGLYKSGGTISILSYYFAKNLGFDPIVFVGLDLAFIGNKINAEGLEAQMNVDGSIHVGCNLYKQPMLVKGYNGQMIPSRDDYALFIRHFNEIFTTENNPARVINTATSGALIHGVEYMEFKDLVSSLPSQKTGVSKTLSDVFGKTSDKWLNWNNNVYKELKSRKEKIADMDKTVKEIFDELQEICELFEDYKTNKNSLGLIEAKIENTREPMAQMRKAVLDDVFLSTYLQNEIWQYTQNYKANILPSLDDIRHNMTVEKDFFKVVCWATENINQWLDEAIARYEGKLPASIASK